MDVRFRSVVRRFAGQSVCCGIYTPEFMVRKFGRDWKDEPALMEKEGFERITTSRRTDLGDSIMIAIVLAPFAVLPATFQDLRGLREQECERVAALRAELTKCGAKIIEKGDSLEVFPSKLRGAE